MTILANVKGYINGAERGVTEAGPSLLTYEEIVAMATAEGEPGTNTIAELNTNAETYYNMLNDGGYLTRQENAIGTKEYYTINGIARQDGGIMKLKIGYNSNLWASDDFDS